MATSAITADHNAVGRDAECVDKIGVRRDCVLQRRWKPPARVLCKSILRTEYERRASMFLQDVCNVAAGIGSAVTHDIGAAMEMQHYEAVRVSAVDCGIPCRSHTGRYYGSIDSAAGVDGRGAGLDDDEALLPGSWVQ